MNVCGQEAAHFFFYLNDKKCLPFLTEGMDSLNLVFIGFLPCPKDKKALSSTQK